MPEPSSISQLAELLVDMREPVIRPQRLAPATIYDIDYRWQLML